MKKIFISALALSTAATVAQAGPLNLDLRADYSATTYTDAALPDSNRFYLRTGRVDYQGKAFEDVSFRVRLSFTKSATPNGTDSMQPAAEFAYLSHKLSDMLSLTIGKMNTDVGGFEGNTSGSDLYLLSTNYNKYTGQATAAGFPSAPAAYYGTSDMLYMTGAKLTMTFAEGTNSVQLMGMNQKNDETAATSAMDQNGLLMGLVYKGSFMDKALNFIASYHTSEGAVVDSKYQWMAAGVMWNADPIAISVDYLLNDEKNDTGTTGKNELSSVVVKFAYTGMEQWIPRLDFFSSKRKDELSATAVDTDWTGYGAVLEYRPYNDKNFRYHLAYNNIKESPEGATDDIIKHEVIVGTRFLGDFLK